MTDITGTPGDELLTGTDSADAILAGAGDDTVMGLGGNDYLAGQSGDDLLNGGSGDDTLVGGQEADSLTGGSGDDLIYAGDPTRDVIDGGSGHDTLSFANLAQGVTLTTSVLEALGIEAVVGSDFDDRFTCDSGVNKVNGAGGDDLLSLSTGTLIGGAGDDVLDLNNGTLVGGAGDDILGGGAGLMLGGAGKDTITPRGGTVDGGAGSDMLIAPDHIVETFRFGEDARRGVDVIKGLADYHIIDLSPIDADIDTAGDQAFHLVSSLDGHAAEASLTREGNATVLRLDVDGDGLADFTVRLDGDHTDFTNFVL